MYYNKYKVLYAFLKVQTKNFQFNNPIYYPELDGTMIKLSLPVKIS